MTSKADRENERRLAILADLMKEPENKECADCGAKGPRWASWSLGIFLCINCAGIHRSLGTHISKVKSATLDKWTEEQVESMQNMGNGRAKDIYEANVPSHYVIPNQGSSSHALENWIKAKYERKEFMANRNRNITPSASPAPSPSRERRDDRESRENRERRRAEREKRRADRERRREEEDRERERERMVNTPSPTPITPVAPPQKHHQHQHQQPTQQAPKSSTDLTELLGFGTSQPSAPSATAPATAKVDKASIMSLYATPMQPSHNGIGIHTTTNHVRMAPNYNVALPGHGYPSTGVPYVVAPHIGAPAMYGMGAQLSYQPAGGLGYTQTLPLYNGVAVPLSYNTQPQVRLN